MVDETLVMVRRAHYRLLDRYRQEKALYLARRPIEELRHKMLRDAGAVARACVRACARGHTCASMPAALCHGAIRCVGSAAYPRRV